MLKKRLKGLLALALAAILSVTMLTIPSAAESTYYIFVTDQVPEDRSDRTSTTCLMVDYGSGNVEMALPATVYSLALSYGTVDPIQEITGWKAWGGRMYSGDGGYNHWEKRSDNVAVGASGGDTVTIDMAQQAENAGVLCFLSLEIEWRYRTLEFPLYDAVGNFEKNVTITADKDGKVTCTGYKDGTKCLISYGTVSPGFCKTKEELWKALTDIAAAQGESFTDSKIRLVNFTVDNARFEVAAPVAGEAAPSGDIAVVSTDDVLKARISKWTDKDGNTVDKFENCKDYTVHIDFYCQNDDYEISPDLSVMLGDISADCEIEQGKGVYSFSYTFEGQHETLIKHAAKAATCTEEGNIAYYECKDCGALFAVSESDTLVEIALEDTVIPVTDHIFLDKYESDANSHWHVCAVCSKASEKEAHRGGTATVTKKAVCEVCGQEYGDYAKPAETTTTTATTLPITGPTGTRPNTPVTTVGTTTTATTTASTTPSVEDDEEDIDDDTLTPPDEENKIMINADSAADVDKIIAEIENADDGTTIVINVNTHISDEEQARISTALMGRDLILVADYGDYRWIIDSNDITSDAPLFPEVAIGAENVASNDGWMSLFNEYDLFEKFNEYDLFNENADMLGEGGFRFWTPNRKNDNSMRLFESLLHIVPISINHDGGLEYSRLEFNIIDLGKFNIRDYIDLGRYWDTGDINAHFVNGDNDSLYFANLYRITDVNELNNNGFKFDVPTLDFCGSFPFDDDGLIGLYFDHASDYIVVVDKYDHSKDADKAIKTVSSVDGASDDSNPHTGVTLGFAAVFIAGAAAAVSRKKKK